MTKLTGNNASTHRRSGALFGWLFATPAVLAGLVVTVYPLLYLVSSSLFVSTLGQPYQDYVGGEQFQRALTDHSFLTALLRTGVFALITACLQLALGTGIALLLWRQRRMTQLLRTVLLLPLLTPPVMAAVVWKLILAPGGGMLNAVLLSWGITDEPISLLGSPRWAIVMIGLADTWQWVPFVVLLVYAGLLVLPQPVFEAAETDGAGPWAVFRHLTLPMLMPTLVSVLLIKLIMSFKIFDLVYVLTSGGPADASMLSGFLIFRTAMREFNVGYASAQTLLFVLLVTLITVPIALLRKRVRWTDA